MERMYLIDPLKCEFSSKVRRVEDVGDGSQAVYLDFTYFYPTSGGQPHDTGTIDGFRVIDVVEDDSGVRHVIDGRVGEGDEVECRVDWDRRFDHMQQHSGQHLLSRVFEDLYGLRTVSFHLGSEVSTIDLDTDSIQENVLREVEDASNKVIWRGIPIKTMVLSRGEFVEALESGNRLWRALRSKLPDDVEDVRVVEIEDFDVSTCCGTHCSSTAEIGIIKLLGTEKVKGIVRVEFLCGLRALRDFSEKSDVLSTLSAFFSSDWRSLPRLVEKVIEENKSLKKKKEELLRELARRRASEMEASSKKIGSYELVKGVVEGADMEELRTRAFSLRDGGQRVVLLGASEPKPAVIFACSRGAPVNMGEIMSECMGEFGGRGGGGKDFAQGGGIGAESLQDVLDRAESIIREKLRDA